MPKFAMTLDGARFAILIGVVVLLVVVAWTLARASIDPMHAPRLREVDFAFKRECSDENGVLYMFESGYDSKEGIKKNVAFSNPEAGVLLGCQTVEDSFGAPFTVLASELETIDAKIRSGEYAPKTERDRLVLYFELVYPNSRRWSSMSLGALQEYYQSLEIYYKFPGKIAPATKIEQHRPPYRRFYQTPNGVVLDQDPDRLGVTTRYIEVVHFGNNNSIMTKPQQLFSGTYYYPVRGSGLFLPLGNTLTAYNKIHALRLLHVTDEEILRYVGGGFLTFLGVDSKAWWADFVKSPRNRKRYALEDRPDEYWATMCVLNKYATTSDSRCDRRPMAVGEGGAVAPDFEYGMYSKQVKYIPDALHKIIDEMVGGKCVRRGLVKDPSTKKYKEESLYYGGGDTIDRFLAQRGQQAGLDTMQFIREAQMSAGKSANIGVELVDLRDAMASQSRLMRLDPFQRPYEGPENLFLATRNYEIDASNVSSKLLAVGVIRPFKSDASFDVLVPKRNFDYWNRY